MNHLEIFAESRTYLFALAHRMSGSVTDAEDLLQETFLRWQQTSLCNIRSPRAFLTTVLKHLCLNHLQSARVRREECYGTLSAEFATAGNLDELASKQSHADSLARAFVILLERLSPKEQLVLLLREVFDFEYEEIAEIVRKSAVSCRQILRRARQHILSGHSRFVASPEQLEKLARQFARTCASGDWEGLVSLLVCPA